MDHRVVRVLIVDDHPVVCRGLAELIGDEPDMEVCGIAGDADEAYRLVEVVRPDVVVVDISLPSGNGIELIAWINSRNESIRTLVCSMHDESLFAERALRAGARGYVSKQEDGGRIVAAIREVLCGHVFLSAKMASRLLQGSPGDGALEPLGTLTNRELEVFELIGEGMATKKIAARLHLSPKTIESHRESVKRKLNLANSAELTRRAVQWVLEKH